uniref:Uncharacterized protein n=1 Tax=Erwinia amylovora ATCC BAA-2158 TaxID=889211 RepID=E5B2S8_ERWAM|nr:hypothetical protein predicted by Glimmer/Critica [Erwinia amylovora ATCC BAA-2158]
MFKRFFILALFSIAGLLTACQSTSNTAPSCADHASADLCLYLTTMKQRIQDNFDHAEDYHGQRCAVSLKYGAHRRYQVLSTQGDEPLCLKAWSTVANAGAMPPPPPEMANGVLIDLRP